MNVVDSSGWLGHFEHIADVQYVAKQAQGKQA